MEQEGFIRVSVIVSEEIKKSTEIENPKNNNKTFIKFLCCTLC